jgi:hypothetical protein
MSPTPAIRENSPLDHSWQHDAREPVQRLHVHGHLGRLAGAGSVANAPLEP